MHRDLDLLLRDWDAQHGVTQARLIDARDGRQVLQVRLDLGILQLEIDGRPDGARPHGFSTYFDYLLDQARQGDDADNEFRMNAEQSSEADREFVQYFQRRIAWLSLREFDRAVADADHTLAFMDFVRDRAPTDEYRLAHEQFRGFVLFHRAQALAARAIEANDPESAVDAVQFALAKIQAFFTENELEDQMDEDVLVVELRKLEQSLRNMHGIEETLNEQLARAVANEEYETAARLRDEIRQRR